VLAISLLALVPVLIIVSVGTSSRAEQKCSQHPVECGVATGIATSALTATAISLVWFGGIAQLSALVRYRSVARKSPAHLLPSTPGLGTIVGREPIVESILEELRSSRRRDPVLVVGESGSGKTALLLLIAQQLAKRGLIPVLVTLRGRPASFDLNALAFERLAESLDRFLPSRDYADRIWRRLRASGRIVILADAIDEIARDLGTAERRSAIRESVAVRSKDFPLVITSRPPNVPANMPTARYELPPLSVEEATAVVRANSTAPVSDQNAAAIVGALDLQNAPFFLSILNRAPDWVPRLESGSRGVLVARRALMDAAFSSAGSERFPNTDLGILALCFLVRDTYELELVVLGETARALGSELDPHELQITIEFWEDAEVLISRGHSTGRTVQFTHPIMMTYFAALVIGELAHSRERLLKSRLPEAFHALAWAASVHPPTDGIFKQLLETLSPQRALLATAHITSASDVTLPPSVAQQYIDNSEPGDNDTVDLIELLRSKPQDSSAVAILVHLLSDESYEIRWSAARALATGTDATFGHVENWLTELVEGIESRASHEVSPTDYQEKALWFLPRLAVRCRDGSNRAAAVALLQRLTECVRDLADSDQPGALGAESSLAQGIKLSAAEQSSFFETTLVRRLAQESRFWYARCEALQALALQPDTENTDSVLLEVSHQDPHPFVKSVAEHARAAVRFDARDRYLWDSELSIVSSPLTSLHPEALITVGEIALLLNLSENADQIQRDANASKSSLPLCFSDRRHRSRLISGEGCAPGCDFDLCPYIPHQRQRSTRGTFAESFCRAMRHAVSTAGCPKWFDGSARSFLEPWETLERLTQ
jgi:NACHT domain.